MADQHHLLLITTDQQRADTIAAAGCPWMRTRNLAENANPLAGTDDLVVRPRRPLRRGDWPGFRSVVQTDEVCH